jgi:hypothetical protein
MNLFENLVKRTFEMHRAGAQAMPMFGPNKAIASVINKLSEIGIPDNLNNLALRMFRILRRVARLQVTISPPELPAILYPEPAYQEAALEEAYPSIEEPPEFVVTSRFDPLTGIIRRMVRSFLRRPRRPEPEEEPPEPPPSRRERVYTIPEYLQRIVAAIPPLVIIPPRPRPRPEIEKPRLGAEKRLETIVAPKGVEVLEKIYELVEEYEAPGMGVPLVPKVEPLKAVPPSLRMPPRMRRVRRGFQDLAKWVGGVSAAEPVITEIGLVDTYVEMQTSVYDVVSKQAEFRRFRPTYDWRPLILEATRIASERVFAWGRGEEEAGRPEAYAGPQIEGVAEALKGLVEGEFPPYVAEVLTREAESKTALVSSEVERVSRQLAEEAAETYRQALAELLPVHSRAAVKELVHAPGLKELVTKKLRTSLEIMGIKEALLEEITERGLELGTKHPLQDYIEKIARLAGITRPGVPTYPVEEEDKVPTISPFHPIQEYVTRVARLAGITRPGVPTYPVEEEDKVPTISPFHPIQEYVTRVARFAGLTKVELPIPGEEEIRLPIPTPIQPLQEYIDIAHKLAEASKLEEPIISIEEEVEEIARAPRHPIKAYLDLASRLGEFMGTRAAAVYGITAAHVPEVEYLGGELEVYKTFDFLSVVKEIVTSKVKAEKALTTALSGVVSSLLEVPVGEQALERVGLEVPVTVPSPRLLDMVPVLSRVEAIPRAQRSPTVRRERALERRRPIEIKVEPKIGDIDLRELERKIARILREEARRYGVY